MKICSMCKSEVENDAIFCPHCGVNLMQTPAENPTKSPTSTATEELYSVQNGNPNLGATAEANSAVVATNVPTQIANATTSANAKVASIRAFFASKSWLIVCVLLTCTLALTVIGGFILGASVGVTLLSSVVGVLFLASTWVCYANAKSTSAQYSPSGLKFMRTLLSIFYVFIWVGFVALVILVILLFVGSGMFASAFRDLLQSTDGLKALIGVGGLTMTLMTSLLAVVGVFGAVAIMIVQMFIRWCKKELAYVHATITNPLAPTTARISYGSKISTMLFVVSAFCILGSIGTFVSLSSMNSIMLLNVNSTVTQISISTVMRALAFLVEAAAFIKIGMMMKKHTRESLLAST